MAAERGSAFLLKIGDGAETGYAGFGIESFNTVAIGAGSWAFGDNATALGANAWAVGQQSTAIGVDAFASGTNAVALGVGSEASRNNTVSVGSAGNERQITNVAAGTEDTDAVNKSQLDAVQSQLDQGAAVAVKYDDPGKAKITLEGADGTTIGNVADGVDANDAVNKGQLDAAITSVANGLGDLADSAVTSDDVSKGQITLAGSNGTRISNLQASDVASDAATVGQLADVLSAFGGGAMLQAGLGPVTGDDHHPGLPCRRE